MSIQDSFYVYVIDGVADVYEMDDTGGTAVSPAKYDELIEALKKGKTERLNELFRLGDHSDGE